MNNRLAQSFVLCYDCISLTLCQGQKMRSRKLKKECTFPSLRQFALLIIFYYINFYPSLQIITISPYCLYCLDTQGHPLLYLNNQKGTGNPRLVTE